VQSVRVIVAVGACVLASACFPYGAETQRLAGPYILVAIDTVEQSSVAYDLGDGGSIGRVPETVFAVGWDARHIVAARHPHEVDDDHLDKTKTEFFYIIRANDGPYVDPSASVRGPFNAVGFESERRRLGLPGFRREIANLK
jgi:hypothetical protein